MIDKKQQYGIPGPIGDDNDLDDCVCAYCMVIEDKDDFIKDGKDFMNEFWIMMPMMTMTMMMMAMMCAYCMLIEDKVKASCLHFPHRGKGGQG